MMECDPRLFKAALGLLQARRYLLNLDLRTTAGREMNECKLGVLFCFVCFFRLFWLFPSSLFVDRGTLYCQTTLPLRVHVL